MKCKVCGKRFELKKEDKYDVVKSVGVLGALSGGSDYFEAFDCPHCGCQNIVNVKERRVDHNEMSVPQEDCEDGN